MYIYKNALYKLEYIFIQKKISCTTYIRVVFSYISITKYRALKYNKIQRIITQNVKKKKKKLDIKWKFGLKYSQYNKYHIDIDTIQEDDRYVYITIVNK